VDTHDACAALEDVELALRVQAAKCNNEADAGAWQALATEAYLLRAGLEGLLNGCSAMIPPSLIKPGPPKLQQTGETP